MKQHKQYKTNPKNLCGSEPQIPTSQPSILTLAPLFVSLPNTF